ncbi:MAG TPA: alkaline phosphatase family protein [Vicinamibacterales bacterium]|nr:alkaline phosphatase family protein [Vicinamibacterales bacterium]HOQ59821.1 alkaline phosphatase family protein [Vicinamibacterales bacterium]
MKPITSRLVLPGLLVLAVTAAAVWSWGRAPRAITVALLEAPGRGEVPAIGADAATLISGRRVTPAGRTIRTQSYNWGMAVAPDQSRVALIRPSAIEIVGLAPDAPSVRLPPYGEKPAKEFGEGTYMGVAFSPDNRLLYFGSANAGEIKAMDVASSRIVWTVSLDGGGYRDSFAGDFALGADGQRLYALDQFNYRLAIVDVKRRAVVRSVRVGRNPFSVSLSPDGRHAWVTNVGMFEYPLLPGVTEANRATAGLTFPAYGVPSKEAEDGTVAEGLGVPGLGSPNHPDAMSLVRVDLETGAVTARVKTGYLVGAERDGLRTIGGSSPGGVVAGRRRVYVSNATNDTITVVDAASGAVAGQIALDVPGLERLRGVIPFGLALGPDERRLYVACAGLNAVAVVDTEAQALEGYIPAGWFTSDVAVSPDGRTLYVSSAKGLGSGPNGGRGFVAPARGLHPAEIMQGTLQIVPVPAPGSLEPLTRQVLDNTLARREAVVPPGHPLYAALAGRAADGPIRHVVFVVKENRTFDQVFGQRRGVDGDPSLTTLGFGMPVKRKDGTLAVDGANVSPNHQALADAYAISDNFYCDADQSNTGHRWVAGVYPNEWVEVNARSRIEERLFSPAPGRRYVSGSSAVVNPEDYNEAGALWEHLDRHGVPFFNFGFGTEMPASIAQQAFKETGIRMAVSFPLPKPLFDRTSRKYATFNMAIPDQYRMDMFEEELRDRWLSGKEAFPRLVTLVLPNDHLTEEHPADGYPFVESYMADNDLALGRLIHTLSRTPWWENMLVIVTEDDPQGGRDHVEAHRSILMLIGPHVRRGYVSHTLADFGSIMRLIFTVLGLPPLNQFDAVAPLPLDLFAVGRSDASPYTARPPDARIFNPDEAFKPFDRRFNWQRLAGSPRMDDPDDMLRPFREPGSAQAAVVLGGERR